jgi:hypothetical protein
MYITEDMGYSDSAGLKKKKLGLELHLGLSRFKGKKIKDLEPHDLPFMLSIRKAESSVIQLITFSFW